DAWCSLYAWEYGDRTFSIVSGYIALEPCAAAHKIHDFLLFGAKPLPLSNSILAASLYLCWRALRRLGRDSHVLFLSRNETSPPCRAPTGATAWTEHRMT